MHACRLNDILKNNLCCGCGTCAAVCPVEAIKITKDNNGQYLPQINFEVCNECNLCFKVCPNNSFNYLKELSKPIEVYTGYSNNSALRYSAASGGMVTQLIKIGLEADCFDCAVVITGNTILDFSPAIVMSSQMILKHHGSKYIQIPVNLILNDLFKSEFNKICFVGLPCHIRGLNNYLKIHKKLSKRIAIKFSLVCGQVVKYAAVKRQLKALSIDINQVKYYSFRGSGWPGQQTIITKSKQINIPHTDKLAMGGLFSSPLCTVEACTYCQDHFAMESDISFCDAWHAAHKKKGDGFTTALCWSLPGKKFLTDIVSRSDELTLEKDEYENVLRAQGHMKPKGEIVHLLKKKISSTSIVLNTDIEYGIKEKFTAEFYLLFFRLFNIVSIKFYPITILSLTRVLRKLLR